MLKATKTKNYHLSYLTRKSALVNQRAIITAIFVVCRVLALLWTSHASDGMRNWHVTKNQEPKIKNQSSMSDVR